MAEANPQSQDTTGLATDARGNPVIDPTKNVLDLVGAAIERQDDLRAVESKALREYMDSKFAAIEREFALIESRRVEQKVDTKVAVDAALSAAEKAVKEQTVASEKSIIKSETSAAEQSKQQNATFTAALKGVTDVLSDVKERVGKIETLRQGGAERQDNTARNLSLGIAAAAVVYAILSNPPG